MRTSFDQERGRITLELPDLETVESFMGGAKKQDGFLLPLPEELPRGKELEVVVTAPDGFELDLPVKVLHVFGAVGSGAGAGYTTALQIVEWGEADEARFRRALEGPDVEAGEDGEGGEDGEEEEEAKGETLGASPIFRIQKMTPPEKARLALRANRTERQILLRETSPQVMMALLNNPHLEADDVAQIVKSPYAPGGVLKRVAGDRRWVQNHEVRVALVRNPQTPPPLAIRLLTALPTPMLQALGRSSEVREDLKKAALKLYLTRMGK